MASQVGETAALRLHATELLMLLGTAIVLLVEAARCEPQTEAREPLAGLPFSSAELLDNR